MTNGHFQSHYIPNTPGEQAGMLASLGVSCIDELFADIPEEHRNPPLRLPDPLPELEIQRELGALAGRNRTLGSGPSFLGAGSYHHFIPSIVKSLVTRGEFITAYTPYQAEASQGTLQVIYEFQTLDLQPVWHGSGQRRHVRRRHQPGRGRADGLPRHAPRTHRRAGHRVARLPRGHRGLLPSPKPGGGHCQPTESPSPSGKESG